VIIDPSLMITSGWVFFHRVLLTNSDATHDRPDVPDTAAAFDADLSL
jgi:hypothetical protein